MSRLREARRRAGGRQPRAGGALRFLRHSSASHARGGSLDGGGRVRRLVRGRRPAEATAGRLGGKVREAERGKRSGMNLKLAGGAEMRSPVALFMQADIVVKSVMIGLILASIWTWAIIIGHALRIKKVARENERFERDFWKAQDIDRFHEAHGREDWPSAKIFSAGIAEWRDRKSTRLNSSH